MSQRYWESSRFEALWRSPLFEIQSLRYLAPEPCSSGEEAYHGHAVFFYRRGHFELQLGGAPYLVDPTSLVYNHDREPWQVALPKGVEVEATEIVFSKAFVDQVVGEFAGAQRGPFPTKQAATTAEINRLHDALLREIASPLPGARLLVDALATAMCVAALRRLARQGEAPAPASAPDELDRVAAAKALMAEAPPDEVSLARLAGEAGLSPFHFLRTFKRHTGRTPHQHLTALRMQRAKRLLRDTALGVTEVAVTLGYSNPSHFSAQFRRHVGRAPAAYRARPD